MKLHITRSEYVISAHLGNVPEAQATRITLLMRCPGVMTAVYVRVQG